ncbi:hypothetical protein INR49_001560, partial [Caranx melampygus]
MREHSTNDSLRMRDCDLSLCAEGNTSWEEVGSTEARRLSKHTSFCSQGENQAEFVHGSNTTTNENGTQTSHRQLYHVPLNAIRPFRVEFEVYKGVGNSTGFSSGWCPQTMTNSSRAMCMETGDC